MGKLCSVDEVSTAQLNPAEAMLLSNAMLPVYHLQTARHLS